MFENTTESTGKNQYWKQPLLLKVLDWNTQTFLLTSFRVGLCSCWEYSRKSYPTLNSNQPNRKRLLKIILTKWVVTGGESKAELSTWYFQRQWKPGVLLPKEGTHYRSFNWPWLGSSLEAEWLILTLPVVNPAVGKLKPGTSLPGGYSDLSCSGKLIIFTNVLSPNLLNSIINYPPRIGNQSFKHE